MKVKRLVFCLMLSVMLVVTFIPATGFAVEAETDNDVMAEGLTDGTDEEGSLGEITFEGVDEDDYLWSDGTVTYNVVLPDDVVGDFNLIVGVGNEFLTEWDPEFTEGVEYSYEDGTLTLDGKKIFKKLGEKEGDITAYATITDADGETLLAEGFTSIYVREASADYYFPEDESIVLGMERYFSDSIEAYVYGAEYPDGASIDCPITDMKVKEQDPDGVVSLRNEDSEWICSADKLGTAVIEVIYEDVNQEEKTYTFILDVVETSYDVYVDEEEGRYAGLPGDSLHLYANTWKNTANGVDENAKFEYEWTITKGAEFAEIEQDAKDSSKAVVTFNENITGDEDGYLDEEVTVRAAVKEPAVDNEIKASSERNFAIRNEYYAIGLDDPDSFNADLGVGESMTITPELHHFQVGQDSNEVIEGAKFSIVCFSDGEFNVTEQDGTFTLKRLNSWETGFYIRTSLDNEGEISRTFNLNSVDDVPSNNEENEFADPNDADAEVINPGEEKDVNTEVKDGLFKFTAESDGKYVFYSKPGESYCNPRGRVVDLELSEEDQVLADESETFENYLDLEDNNPNDFQIYFDAEAGHTYYLQAINCYGTGEFTVGLVKSDIASISYKHVRDPYPLREGIDTYTRMDDEGLTYWNVDWPEEGDELTITKTDGAKATYQFKSLSDGTGSGDSDWAFVNKDNAEDVLPAWPRIEDIPVNGDEEVGDTFNVDLTYAGCKTEMQFKIFENPIQSIEPSTENITVDLVEDEDDGVDYVADWDDITFTVKTKDGDTNEYHFNAEEYDNHIYGGWMYCEEIDDSFHCLCGPWGYDEENDANWEVGGNYTTTLKTAGVTINLNVNVVKHEHQWGTYIEPATLDEDGMQMQQCEICGESKDETKETIYHPDKYTFAKAVYTGEPVEPELTITDTEGEVIAASNYDVEYSNNAEVGTASAVVTFKGKYYSGVKDDLTFEIEPGEDVHTHDMTAHKAVEATCTEAGNNAYWECSECGKFFSDEEGTEEIEEDSWIIEALGHDYEKVAGSAETATCTKDGKEADQKCSRCEDVKTGKTIPALGHDYEKVAGTAVVATLTEDGKDADQKCSRCQEEKGGEVISHPETYTFASAIYNGSVQKPVLTIKDAKGIPIDAKDYTVTYDPNSINAGTWTAKIEFDNDKYHGSINQAYTINKADPWMVANGSTKKLKAKKLKKKAQSVYAISANNGWISPLTYSKISGSSKLKVNPGNGKITVKKKTKKGTYKIRVRVTSAATANYNATYRDVTVTVKVKK